MVGPRYNVGTTAVPELIRRLDAAPNATAREELLAGCSPEQLAALDAAFAYRACEIAAAVSSVAFEMFTDEVTAAPDDTARLQIIAAATRDPERGEDFVREWTLRRTLSAEDALGRYTAMLGAS
jgi:hypothetical protein